MRRLQFSNYLVVLSSDSLVARTRAGRCSYVFLHVSAYGPEFSRQRVGFLGSKYNQAPLGELHDTVPDATRVAFII